MDHTDVLSKKDVRCYLKVTRRAKNVSHEDIATNSENEQKEEDSPLASFV